ncbi:MAG: hypothetical protein KVP17_002808 [Porospora cf. gigantea B]|uniref:uncharacterized protein n=1 Tax=Porospora cf. gigantea B TaxID=2853592 RepID=UPI003571D67F|nr:MAG: hypothetical protein KVP17_002808 [Porospora cf. gigantea B]
MGVFVAVAAAYQLYLAFLMRETSVNASLLSNMDVWTGDFGGLDTSMRKDVVNRMLGGQVLINPSVDALHGKVGLLEDGSPLFQPLTSPISKKSMASLLREGGGFNLELSNRLPLERSVPESRHPECKTREWYSDSSSYSKASVVIVFFNEPFSTLASVRRPDHPDLLEEVILVDDGSDVDWITGKGEYAKASADRKVEVRPSLQELVAAYPKTRLVRLPERKGIVGARLAGIRAAKAPIFVILDSHIECGHGWLEPMIHRISEDPRRILMPQIDGIEQETFAHETGGIGCTLGFLWKLMEHAFDAPREFPEVSLPERMKAGPTDFVSSPAMAGGLFAASVEFFESIGAYDPLFEHWGTENLEFSFRLWQCGGILECVPCSRVYHIFRKGGVGYTSPIHSVTRNKLRTLSIWMDEYADLAWRVIGRPKIPFGEIETMQAWRKTKGCKSMKWYLENVNPESYVVDLEKDVPFLGPLKHAQSGMCLEDTSYGGNEQPLALRRCSGRDHQEFMYFTRTRHVMPVLNDEMCLPAPTNMSGYNTTWCHNGSQPWIVRVLKDSERPVVQLTSPSNGYGSSKDMCLAATESRFQLLACDQADESQHWVWSRYRPPKEFHLVF